MSNTAAVFNLNDLESKRAVEWDGTTYRIRGVTLRIAKLIDVAQAAPDEGKLQAYLDVVAAIVPDLPTDALEDLSLSQITSIINLANPHYEIATADPGATDGEAAS